MKTAIKPTTPAIATLIVCLLLVFPLVAQQNKGNDKTTREQKKEEGTIHLRIEKYEDGQKKVYEHTYEEGDFPSQPFPDGFMFDTGDSLKTFKFYGKNLLDSIMIRNPSGKIFLDSTDSDFSGNQFFYRHNLDSLLSGHMFYNFDYSLMPTIDSLVKKSLDASSFIFKNMDKAFQFQFDTLFENGFDFNWDTDRLNFQGDNLNLYLDKEQYELEEIEKDGKKMIQIKPKKSFHSMQPSEANLNLMLNRETGIVSLRFQVPEDGTTFISVMNTQGKIVYKEKAKNKAGEFTKEIDLKRKGAGTYTILVQHNGKTISREVTIP